MNIKVGNEYDLLDYFNPNNRNFDRRIKITSIERGFVHFENENGTPFSITKNELKKRIRRIEGDKTMITIKNLAELAKEKNIQEFTLIKDHDCFHLSVLVEGMQQNEPVFSNEKSGLTKTYTSADTWINFLHKLNAKTIDGEDVPIRIKWRFSRRADWD